MTFSRTFQFGGMVVLACALAWIWYQNRQTNDLIGGGNALVAEATELSRIAKQKNEALAALSTDDVIKNRRTELQTAAQETNDALRKTAAKWREVAELNDRLVDERLSSILCRDRTVRSSDSNWADISGDCHPEMAISRLRPARCNSSCSSYA